MNKEILYEILKSKSETLSSAEIESIMNEELDKSPEDMDTDLIDLCLEALNTVDEEKLNRKKRKYRFGRVIIAAAVFALVIGITIPVCAKYLSINVPAGIVTIYKECFNIDLTNKNDVIDIASKLERDGIDGIILPEIMFNTTTTIADYHCENSDSSVTIEFAFHNNDTNGYVTIEKYNSYDFLIRNKKASSDFENFKTIITDNINILVFGTDNYSYISYIVGNTEYNITLECNYDYAYQIAKTI